MWWDTLWKLTDYCACDIQATPPGSCRTSARRYLRIALFENCFFLTHHKLCHTTLCTQIPRNCSESTQFISLNFPELTNSLEIPGSLRWYRPSFCLHHILFFFLQFHTVTTGLWAMPRQKFPGNLHSDDENVPNIDSIGFGGNEGDTTAKKIRNSGNINHFQIRKPCVKTRKLTKRITTCCDGRVALVFCCLYLTVVIKWEMVHLPRSLFIAKICEYDGIFWCMPVPCSLTSVQMSHLGSKWCEAIFYVLS